MSQSNEQAKPSTQGQWLTAGLILVIGMPIALWFTSCSKTGGEDDPVARLQASQQQEMLWIAKGQEAVRAKLKDGASATFRNEAVRRQSGAPLACGEVNSKNSFGGYSGFQRYIFMGSQLGALLEEEMTAAEFDKLWSQTCLR